MISLHEGEVEPVLSGLWTVLAHPFPSPLPKKPRHLLTLQGQWAWQSALSSAFVPKSGTDHRVL